MCGIIGVVGSPILWQHCSRASRAWSIAATTRRRGARSPRGDLAGRAAEGTESVQALRKECEEAPPGFASGIGHTRWATHGAPVTMNAHPHLDCSGHIAIIHNGIIENHGELQEQLESRGTSLAHAPTLRCWRT